MTDYVYSFVFKASFNSLDGIYRVASILSYPEVIELEISLLETIYKTNGLDEVVFNTDLPTIRSGQIYKLVSVTDSKIIYYIPEHILKEIPNASVQKYLKLGLAVNIGIFEDPNDVSTLKSEVDQTVAAMVGSSNNSVIYTVDEEWMTTDQYGVIKTAREAAITKINNHFTDNVALRKQIDQLQTLVQYYENTLKTL